MVYEMLDTEGIYIGASSALNVVAAYEMAQKLGPGKSLLLFEVKIWIRSHVSFYRQDDRDGAL